MRGVQWDQSMFSHVHTMNGHYDMDSRHSVSCSWMSWVHHLDPTCAYKLSRSHRDRRSRLRAWERVRTERQEIASLSFHFLDIQWFVLATSDCWSPLDLASVSTEFSFSPSPGYRLCLMLHIPACLPFSSTFPCWLSVWRSVCCFAGLLASLCCGAVAGGIKFCTLGAESCTFTMHSKKVEVHVNSLYISMGRNSAPVDALTQDQLSHLLEEAHSKDEWVRLIWEFNESLMYV